MHTYNNIDMLNTGRCHLESCEIENESIARMAGFKNRTSFYTSFNREMGITPKQYIDKNTNRLVS